MATAKDRIKARMQKKYGRVWMTERRDAPRASESARLSAEAKAMSDRSREIFEEAKGFKSRIGKDVMSEIVFAAKSVLTLVECGADASKQAVRLREVVDLYEDYLAAKAEATQLSNRSAKIRGRARSRRCQVMVSDKHFGLFGIVLAEGDTWTEVERKLKAEKEI